MANSANINVEEVEVSKLVETFVEFVSTNGIKLIIGFIILSVGFKLIKKFIRYFVAFLEKGEVDITLRRFLESLTSGVLKVILAMIVMEYWGLDLTGLAALVASAGVAVGLALQGSLSNFAGGFIILLLRPFKVGDFIETSGYNGVVEQIGLFYTHLITVDNKEVLIPNGTVSNGSLINYTAKATRMIDMTFSAAYESDVLHVKRVLEDIVSAETRVLTMPEPFIGIREHAGSSVNFVVRVWCRTDDYWGIYYQMLETVKIRFDEENISIPYPQMDVNLKK